MRKSMKKLIALTLTCLMLATLFVGCGSKDEGGGDGGDVIKLGWLSVPARARRSRCSLTISTPTAACSASRSI